MGFRNTRRLSKHFEKTLVRWDFGKETLGDENIFVEIATLVSWRSATQVIKVVLTGSLISSEVIGVYFCRRDWIITLPSTDR